jgi:hypothetical protein
MPGRAELSFDFYDDWDEDSGPGGGGLLGGWGNDELDRLLAGSGSHSGVSEGVDRAPRKKRGMSYGTRGRRKSLEPDPTVIPSTSALGFLGRLPFKLGGTLRYKPSAADLQDHPGALRAEFRDEEEAEPLISSDHDEGGGRTSQKKRERSSTTSSGQTSDSFRSRGDLFPSDGEDDAVPLDDEFAMVLERRIAGSGSDDRSSGKTRSSYGKRATPSRNASGKNIATIHSTQPRPSLAGRRTSSGELHNDARSPDVAKTPTLTDLQLEEQRVRLEEDAEVERKRQAAARLAQERGLQMRGDAPVSEAKLGSPSVDKGPTAISGYEESAEETSLPPNLGASPPKSAEAGFVPARLPNFR